MTMFGWWPNEMRRSDDNFPLISGHQHGNGRLGVCGEVYPPASGWDAEVNAALFVELLCGLQIQGIATDAVAQAVGSHVAKGTVVPRVGGVKYETTIAAHENVLLCVGQGSGRTLRLGFAGRPRSARAPGRILLWRRVIH